MSGRGRGPALNGMDENVFYHGSNGMGMSKDLGWVGIFSGLGNGCRVGRDWILDGDWICVGEGCNTYMAWKGLCRDWMGIGLRCVHRDWVGWGWGWEKGFGAGFEEGMGLRWGLGLVGIGGRIWMGEWMGLG